MEKNTRIYDSRTLLYSGWLFQLMFAESSLTFQSVMV